MSSSFDYSVVSDSLRPHGLQHTRLPWCAIFTISQSLLKLLSTESVMPSSYLSSVVPFSSCLQPFPASGSFPMNQFFASGGQNIYWSVSFRFSISPSSEYSGLISFRIDWFDLLAVQGTLFLAPQFEGINFLALSLFCCPTLMSIHDYGKNHSFDYTDLWK